MEVLRRLWDSWEDDAEIRDVATGRFIDRDKLHYIDFEGRWFSVKGPSITPRPPQGQPIVAALGHASVPYQLIARSADVGFVTPRDAAHAAEIVARDPRREQAARPGRQPGRPCTSSVTWWSSSTRPRPPPSPAGSAWTSGPAPNTTATPTSSPAPPVGLADLLQEWQAAGLSGFRLRPAALPHDLTQITERLVPELRRRGLFRARYEADTLRGLLGLGRPANRYAAPDRGLRLEDIDP